MTFETVAIETEARFATSMIVAMKKMKLPTARIVKPCRCEQL